MALCFYVDIVSICEYCTHEPDSLRLAFLPFSLARGILLFYFYIVNPPNKSLYVFPFYSSLYEVSKTTRHKHARCQKEVLQAGFENACIPQYHIIVHCIFMCFNVVLVFRTKPSFFHNNGNRRFPELIPSNSFWCRKA